MSNEAPRPVQTIGELMDLANLSDMTVYELSGQRLEPADDDPPVEVPSGNEPGDAPMQVFVRHDPERIQVRVRIEAQSPEALFVADIAAEFHLSAPVSAPEEVLREFVERVGVMAAYPYLRESLHSTAARMRLTPPLLQLLKANRVRMVQDEAPSTT